MIILHSFMYLAISNHPYIHTSIHLSIMHVTTVSTYTPSGQHLTKRSLMPSNVSIGGTSAYINIHYDYNR